MKPFRLGISAFLLFACQLFWTATPGSVQETDAVWTIPFGDSVRGVIASPHEAIVYKIDTPFLGRILIDLQVPERCKLDVYDQDGQELGSFIQDANVGQVDQTSAHPYPMYVSSTTFALYLKITPSATDYVQNEAFQLSTTRESSH